MHLPIEETFPVTSLLLAVLLHFIWQTTLIVGMVAIVRSLIHPRFFQARYTLSVVGLVAVLVSPLLTAGYYVSSEAAMMTLFSPSTEILGTTYLAAQPQGLTSVLEAQFQSVFGWFDNNRIFWLGSWMVGFLFLVTRLGISLGYCFQLRRSRQPLPVHIQKLADRLKQRLKLTRKVIVASSREITTAVATGIIKPVVLVPAAWLTQMPVSAIEAVLAHELAHVKRWDLWINLLQRFAETVFFFHPLVWWVSRVITTEREVCCDHLAIKVTGQPMRYVETLAQVAGTKDFDEFEFQFGTAFFGGKNMNLLRRAKMILEPSSVDVQSPFRTLSLIVCVGLLVSYGSYAYCATPAISTIQDQEEVEVIVHQDSGQDEEIEVVLVQEEDFTKVDAEYFNRELIELLHGNDSKNVDHKKLANQLRQLADRLEAGNQDSHSAKPVRRNLRVVRGKNIEKDVKRHMDKDITVRMNQDVELIHEDGKVIHIEVGPEGKHRVQRYMKLNPNGLKRIKLHELKDPKGVIIELKATDDGDLHSYYDADDVTVRGRLHDDLLSGSGKNIFIEEIHEDGHAHAHGDDDEHSHGDHNEHAHGDHDIMILKDPNAKGHDTIVQKIHVSNDGQPHREHTGELHFGLKQESDGDLGKAIRELKNEVNQLRSELHSLRSQRNAPPAKERVRLKLDESKKTDAKGHFEFRLHDDAKGKGASAHTIEGKEGIWTYELNSDDDSPKGKKGVWIESKSDAKANFEYKKMADGDGSVVYRLKKDGSAKELKSNNTIRWVEEKDVKKSTDKKENHFFFKKSDDSKEKKVETKSGISWFVQTPKESKADKSSKKGVWVIEETKDKKD